MLPKTEIHGFWEGLRFIGHQSICFIIFKSFFPFRDLSEETLGQFGGKCLLPPSQTGRIKMAGNQ